MAEPSLGMVVLGGSEPTFSRSVLFLKPAISASAITGTSEESHCWKGFGTNWPSDENHVVNGADISRVSQSKGCEVSGFVHRTTSWYVGLCFVTLEAIVSYRLC